MWICLCQRQEQVSEGDTGKPHLTFVYKDTSIIDDATALVIHHMKRQTGIHKEDKQKIKQLLYHMMPDLFFIPRGELSDDEADKDEGEHAAFNLWWEKRLQGWFFVICLRK